MNLLSKRIGLIALLLVGSLGVLSALFNPGPLFSDHPFFKTLSKQLFDYKTTQQADKVYLQLDRSLYEPGESVWFSAYVRDANTLQASTKSEVVYVELLNAKDGVEQKLTLLAQGGSAAGTFLLPESLKGGQYTLKAYTNWQKNTNTVYKKDITVQKVVLPNLNMSLNFDQASYGAAGLVQATLDLEHLTKTPVAAHQVSYQISLAGSIVHQSKAKTDQNGRAKIQWELPKNLSTNDGLLNIYFTYKDQTESISRSIPIVLGDIDLQFYPEGGQLVADQTCQVGLKALDEFGDPVEVYGEIIDAKNQVVANFSSYHQGMGAFEWTPKAGEAYQARLITPAKNKQVFKLPVATQEGQTLRVVEQTATDLKVEVLSNSTTEMYLALQSRQELYYTKTLEVKAGANQLTIPTTDCPIGIAQLTLFDKNKVAVAERLFFANQDQQLDIQIQTDKEKYLPREKVALTMTVKDHKGEPVEGAFSMAVVDDKQLTFADDKQAHILAQILLQADLKGKIVEPNFYFDDENDPKRLKPEISRAEALDHLLLTQGWRSFAWELVQNPQNINYPYQGELARFAGTILDDEGNPIEGVNIKINNDKTAWASNEKGMFSIDDWKLHEPITLEMTAPDYYPVKMTMKEYNAAINTKMSLEKTVRGILVDFYNTPIANEQVYAAGAGTTLSDAKGNFELKMSNDITKIRVGGLQYDVKEVEVGKGKLVDLERVRLKISIVRNLESVQPTRALSAAPLLKSAVGSVGRRKGNVNKKRSNKAVDMPPPPPPMPAPKEPAVEEVVEMVDEEIEAPMDDLIEEDLALVNEPIAVEELDELEEAGDIEEVVEKERLDVGAIVADQKQIGNLRAQEVRRVPVRVGLTRYQRVRVFPVVGYQKVATKATRTDFRTTIYWNPLVKTDKNGVAKLEFYNSDAVTQFQICVEGFGNAGQIGRVTKDHFTQLPCEMVAKLPREVLMGDVVKLPITLSNNTEEAITGRLKATLPDALTLETAYPETVSIPAGESKTIYLHCKVGSSLTNAWVQLAFSANGSTDQVNLPMEVIARGFPVNEVFSGQELVNNFEINVQAPIEGSVTCQLKAYPSTLDGVISSMESMLRMPGGCFEQTSSSNYPNLLALNYLKAVGASRPEIEARAKEYLKVGYSRLTGYESKGGGFDWWGRSPAHEALTAYGLMQFVDMKAVFPVSNKLIDRTAEWLLSRKNGKGSWKKNPHALHSWAVADVTDAYIVWAVAEAGYGSEIKEEVERSYKNAIKSEDPYQMALLANTMVALNDTRAKTLLDAILPLAQKDGTFTGLSSSVTNSTGHSLKVETSSLVALAMMGQGGYEHLVKPLIAAIQTSKTSYGYGSTQGTVLALKAILEYAQRYQKPQTDGHLALFVDGKKVAEENYSKTTSVVAFENLEQYLKDGKQKLTVKYSKTKSAVPFDIELAYTTKLPTSDPACPFQLSTTLPNKPVQVGQTVRMTTRLTNTKTEGQAMTMAMIGIPAGLSVQTWQLKELQKKKVIDFYEIFEGYVVFHFEEMKPEEEKITHLDLAATIPGQYEAPASSAFLYYTNEHKVWSQPERLKINP